MNKNYFPLRLKLAAAGFAALLGCGWIQAQDAPAKAAQAASPAKPEEVRARALLNAAKAKLRSVQSLSADIEIPQPSPGVSTRLFRRDGVLKMERPSRFRIEKIYGAAVDIQKLEALSDGMTVTRYDSRNHVAYEQPVRKENFFLGQNFLVQFFFDPNGIRFDPSDKLWGRPVSEFDSNVAAYDRNLKLQWLGERTLEGLRLDVVEIKYNTKTNDIRQQVYIGDDKMVYQVDTYIDGGVFSQKFRNFKFNPGLDARTWAKDTIAKAPVVKTDPVRMSAPAPDFTLPGADGKEYAFKQMLQGKKGMYICTLNVTTSIELRKPDMYLQQMRMLQLMKEQFEKQGLAIVAVAGGPNITPPMREEVLLNGLPDLKRFNYPVLIDIDVERGLQGSTFTNFNLAGRNNLLLDSKGRVVFASRDFNEKVNQLAFYQALAQLGFAVSPADLEGANAQ